MGSTMGDRSDRHPGYSRGPVKQSSSTNPAPQEKVSEECEISFDNHYIHRFSTRDLDSGACPGLRSGVPGNDGPETVVKVS